MARGLVPLTALALATALLGAACSGGGGGADPLQSYTDPGDGCAQVVSAISYADSALRPLGQEAYQDFTDAVRSRVAAVDGTAALEVKDFPTRQVRDQARRTGRIATDAMAAGVTRRARIRGLREYRREAAELVLLCGPFVDPRPTPSASAAD